MRYPSGQPVRVSTTVRDLSTGALADPGSLALTVQAPGGARTSYASPDRDGTGLYHQDIPAADLAALGHYQYSWASEGAAAGIAVGAFEVFDPFEVRVLSLQDAKDMLNIPPDRTADDAEIDSWIASIESGLERFTGGPVITRTVTERTTLDGGYTSFCIRQRPLVDVQSVTAVASGQPVDISGGLDVDRVTGVVRTALGIPFTGPLWGRNPAVLVGCTVGWGTAVPAAFNSFARIVIQHMWETQRGPVAMPMAGEQAVAVPGFSFAIPNRAAELLNGSQDGIPFACEAYV